MTAATPGGRLGPQHSLRSFAPAQATDRKTAPPNSHCPHALAIHYFALGEIVNRS